MSKMETIFLIVQVSLKQKWMQNNQLIKKYNLYNIDYETWKEDNDDVKNIKLICFHFPLTHTVLQLFCHYGSKK